SAGGVVNVVTKGGSSDYHGQGFYYLRHKEFAVKDFVGSDRAPSRQQFGFGLGGPVVQGKTFFYTVYDQQEENQPLTVRFSSTSGLPQDIVNKQGTFRSSNDINTYLFKLDSQLTPAQTLSFWPMTVVVSSTSTLQLIPRPPGQHSKSWKPSLSRPSQNISFGIAMPFTDTSSSNNSKPWVLRKYSELPDHLGNVPMSNESSARFAATVSTR
ncbi:MAG: hypothetical protein L0338_37645, partial [Acidobacteria bacterium]|nr:hypothetical protein [Acidobacteriota bacterium]